MENNSLNFGIGVTKQLSLRVSVGVLVKVLFMNPENNKMMLALERTATFRQINGTNEIIVKAKPFGGGIRIIDEQALEERIGKFHYDSAKSRQEKDFRIFVHSESWEKIKVLCMDKKELEKGFLETSPHRELAEEFMDSLNINIDRSQYDLQASGMIIEDLPSKTDNINAQGFSTVRLYYIYEARINSQQVIQLMLNNSSQYSDNELQKMTLEDARHGGKGRANSILVVSMDELTKFYHSKSSNDLNKLIRFKEHQLDGHVIAVLEDIVHPKFKRFI